jgi:hypothetical protein
MGWNVEDAIETPIRGRRHARELVVNTIRIAAIVGFICSNCFGQNFTCSDSYFRQVAEKARVDSAVYWTGQSLRRWQQPCPIVYRLTTNASDGGKTKFSFANGHVYGWSMEVSGRDRQEIANVIRHEVDHAVRATIVRRPVIRWMDEGCASLFESQENHKRLRQEAMRHRNSMHSAWRRMDNKNYMPRSGAGAFYGTSYAVVEYLVRRHGKDKVIAFQRDNSLPTQKFAKYFSGSLASAEQEWNQYVLQYPVWGFQ